MNQPDLFEPGTVERDEAIDRVEEAARPDWLTLAKLAVYALAHQHEFVTADDVAARMVELHPDVQAKEPRAMGAVFRWAQTKGLIEPTDTFRPTTRPQGHRGPRRVWHSTVVRSLTPDTPDAPFDGSWVT